MEYLRFLFDWVIELFWHLLGNYWVFKYCVDNVQRSGAIDGSRICNRRVNTLSNTRDCPGSIQRVQECLKESYKSQKIVQMAPITL